MKAVLISIRPKWCELITSRKKTVEVRKTRPKIETPFKCYIYEKKARSDMPTFVDEDGHVIYTGRGQVIGEFVCDRIDALDTVLRDIVFDGIDTFVTVPMGRDKIFSFLPEKEHNALLNATCLNIDEIYDYLGDKGGYGWHISDLKIYDKPRELGNFYKCPFATESGCTYKYHCSRAGQTQRCGETLTRPPQSWCYVEYVG